MGKENNHGESIEDILSEKFAGGFCGINSGKWHCINLFFRWLMRTIHADSVSVVREKEDRWEVVNEVREAYFGGMRQIVAREEFQRWLTERRSSSVLWGPKYFDVQGGARRLFVSIPVLLRPIVVNWPRRHMVLFVSPRSFELEPKQSSLQNFNMLNWLVSSWISWTHYQREERQDHRNRSLGNGQDVQGVLRKTVWPMTFQETVEVVEWGWPARGNDRLSIKKASRWCRDVLNAPCSLCGKLRPEERLCRGDEQRDLLEKLAKSIEWRLCFEADGAAGELDPNEGDFNSLKGIGSEFLEQCRSDELSGKALLSFFAEMFWRQWLGDEERMKLVCSPGIGENERRKSISRCTYVMHHLIGDTRLDPRTIESIAWAVSRYCHDVLAVPARIDIGSHLLVAARNEPGLHVLKEFYRDHFFHALEVCFLGHFLLDLEIDENEPLWKKIALRLGCPEDPSRVLKLWYLTALLHDVGYSMELLKAVEGQLRYFKNAEWIEQLTDDIGCALKALSEKIGAERYKGYSAQDKAGEDHGVVGALHLERLVETIARDDPEMDAKEYEPAVRAIARHNSRKHTVSFREDPLGFLLIVCDTVQEWNRARLGFAMAPAHILSWFQAGRGPNADLSGPFKKVKIADVKRLGRTYQLDGNGKVHFVLEYDKEVNRNAGVFNLWLDAACNFQRLDFSGLELDIDVEYVTPIYRNPRSGGPENQLHRLRDAARETHMGFLEKWFPTRKNGDAVTNGAVEYRCKDGKEHLILHLRQLSKRNLITKDMDAFWERLKCWKRYNEDRDFSGDYAPAIPD